MPWSMNEEGSSIQLDDTGNPLWIPEEGDDLTPTGVDWSSALGTISRLNGESKTHREASEGLATELDEYKTLAASFEGIDPVAAKDAIGKLANIDQGSLLTADKVESFKNSILEAAESEKARLVNDYEVKLGEVGTERDGALNRIERLVVGNSFANSEFVKNLTVPGDMVENTFANYFKVENDKAVGYLNGNVINSRQRPGEIATFDEALDIIVSQYPNKNMLFPGNPGGSGGSGGSGGTNYATPDEVRNMSVADYEAAKKDGRIAPMAG